MFIEKTMPNGVRVIGQQLPYLHSVSVGAWIGTGSVKEEENEAGLSHFIEHMLFKGTDRRSAQDIAREMDSIGAQINAFTAKECTCYYIKATEEHLTASLDTLGDIVGHSTLRVDEMEKEKGVVVEEILMVDDSPEDLALETLSALFYDQHPLAKPILGNKEQVLAFTQDDLKSYMKKHYTPANTLISIAGNFDPNELMDLVAKHFDAPDSGCDGRFPAIPARAAKRVSVREKDIEQVHICMALPGYGAEDPRYYPLLTMNNALGGNMSSRLFQKIREERGLAYSVYSFTSSYRDTGSLGLYAGTNANTAQDVVELMLEEVRAIRENGITEEEFIRSKNQIRGSYILSTESSSSRMSSIGKSALLYGKARTEEEILEKLDAVTLEDVDAILQDVLDESAMCGVFVGRVGEKLEPIGQLW